MEDASFCLFLTLPRSLLHLFTKKKKKSRRVFIQAEWTARQPISSLYTGCVIRLGYWGRLHCSTAVVPSVYVYVCVCGWAENLMKGNARIGRSLWGTSPSSNVRHPTALWDQGKAASIRACRRTRSDLTGENISTKNIPLRCGEKELSSPPPPSFLFFLFRALSLSLEPPPFFPTSTLISPLIHLEALAGISNLHVWQFVPAWIWRLGGGECLNVWLCICALCALLEVATHTHMHACTHTRTRAQTHTTHTHTHTNNPTPFKPP